MFRYLALLLALSAVAYGEHAQFDEFGRIVGGSSASISDFPYQLSLRWNNAHFCGAALISSTWAVSAAHCTVGRTASGMSLQAGSANRLSGGQVRAVSLVINHPSYNARTIDNDISLLRVSAAFTLSSTVRAVALPSQGQAVSSGVYAVVSGWGTMTEGASSLPTVLQQVSVPVVAQTTCNLLYWGGITSNMLCAGYLAGGRDACQGDSGGPLVSGGSLIGVVSWGSGCARANNPGVYARTAIYRDWIRTNTGV
ncbi:trypsin-1-like [Diprion similis]|uniref:trypsin-1-like n=1 Tax=Diprion similis TaxID=362088 RepID=UPI001EF78E4B|nr:trypsin-1-like [Diprion similis]